MKTRLLLLTLSLIISLIGCIMAWIWFGWKLVLILFIVISGNNIATKLQRK